MSDAPFTATKKCPHCGLWTEWHQQPTDRCQHCGQELEPHRAASNQRRQEQADAPLSPILLIEIKPEDGPVMRFVKYIIRGGQLAFAAVVSFFVWLVTVVAG